jgi:hypothetical protein
MRYDHIQKLLTEAGLREKAVKKMLEEHNQMRRRFQKGEYAEVAVNIGRFSEAVVHILQVELGSNMSKSVRQFAADCLHGELAEHESTAIKQHIPNLLHTAQDIRNERDAVHIDLEREVSHSDARLGIALTSSMLVELIHEYVPDQDEVDLEEVSQVIEEISTPVEENPLETLIASRYEFDRDRLSRHLEGVIAVVEEEEDVKPGPEFADLSSSKPQTVALLLGRLAAHDLGYLEQVGAKKRWFTDRATNSENLIENQLDSLHFVEKDLTIGGYYIPGYQAEEAIKILSDNE